MKTIRSISPEVRIIDAKRGVIDYVASDATLDCYNEVIDPAGWRFTHFAKNSPFVDSHDYQTIGKLLGKVTDFRVEGKQLINRVQWAIEAGDENPLIGLGWKMTTTGFLKAVSVGFMPVKFLNRWRNTPAEMGQACTELGLDPSVAARVSCIHKEQEQLELSACIIGANPNALAKAHTAGAIADADLAACGFDDDGLQFLHDSAAQIEATQLGQVQEMIRGLFGQFARTLSIGPKKKNASPAPGRAAAEEASQRSTAFLSELKNQTKSITTP